MRHKARITYIGGFDIYNNPIGWSLDFDGTNAVMQEVDDNGVIYIGGYTVPELKQIWHDAYESRRLINGDD